MPGPSITNAPQDKVLRKVPHLPGTKGRPTPRRTTTAPITPITPIIGGRALGSFTGADSMGEVSDFGAKVCPLLPCQHSILCRTAGPPAQNGIMPADCFWAIGFPYPRIKNTPHRG